MNTNQQLGKQGEDKALQFLTQKGYQILVRNWRYGKIELDILALLNNILVSVEVKTRSSDHSGAPEESVNINKRKKIIEATNAYIEQNDMDLETRYDIVSILIYKSGKSYIKHIEEAFEPYEIL